MLFTLGALRKVQAGCLLTVSDVVVEGEFKRITDEEMRAAVDQMTELALGTRHRSDAMSRRPSSSSTRRRRTARPDGAGPRSRAAPRRPGSTGDALFSRAAGRARRARARAAVGEGARLVVAVGGDGTVNEAVNGLMRAGADERRARGHPARHRHDFVRTFGIPAELDEALAIAARRRGADDRRRPRRATAPGTATEAESLLRERRRARA